MRTRPILTRGVGLVMAVCACVGTQVLGSDVASATSGWSLVPSPGVPDSTYSYLSSVSCPALDDCFAVGTGGTNENTPSVTSLPLIDHWDGSQWWALDPPPRPNENFLSSVSCPSRTFCVAVGHNYDSTENSTTAIADEWNGRSWFSMAFPDPAGTNLSLSAVTCLSNRDCVAVGDEIGSSKLSVFVARFSGASWKESTTSGVSAVENATLLAVSCSSPTWCVAAGYSHVSSGDTAIILTTSSQTAWAEDTKTVISASVAEFTGASCLKGRTCQVAGYDTTGAGPDASGYEVIESGLGASFKATKLATAVPRGFQVPEGITCSTPTSCVLDGLVIRETGGDTTTTALVQSWNGHKLASVPGQVQPGWVTQGLLGVACSGSMCWGVGSVANSGSTLGRTLIERS
ncbi:MAG: hypothetical protein ACLQNG_17515 [Acidimicrobiales bacterium]